MAVVGKVTFEKVVVGKKDEAPYSGLWFKVPTKKSLDALQSFQLNSFRRYKTDAKTFLRIALCCSGVEQQLMVKVN